jgi:hypothetical protein
MPLFSLHTIIATPLYLISNVGFIVLIAIVGRRYIASYTDSLRRASLASLILIVLAIFGRAPGSPLFFSTLPSLWPSELTGILVFFAFAVISHVEMD